MKKIITSVLIFGFCLPFIKAQNFNKVEIHGYKHLYKNGILFSTTNDSLFVVNLSDKWMLKKSDLNSINQYTSYAFQDIRRIQIKGKMKKAPIFIGAGTGLGTGTVGGFFIGLSKCYLGCPEGRSYGGIVLTNALVGMATGGLIGTLIGYSKRKRKDLFLNGKITQEQLNAIRQTSVLVR